MASSWFMAEDVVDALFNDNFGLSDEHNTKYEEGNHIYGYLGNSIFTDDVEIRPKGDEQETGEVESTPDHTLQLK